MVMMIISLPLDWSSGLKLDWSKKGYYKECILVVYVRRLCTPMTIS